MKKGEVCTPDPRKFTFTEKINRKISLLGKRLGRPVFKYRVNRDSKKYSKEISNILNYYKNNADNLEDEIKSGLDMGLLLECIQNTEHLDGNIVELGTYRGGSTIMFDKFLQHIKSKKRIFACDTFTGFPYEDDRIAERVEQNRVKYAYFRLTSFSYVSEKFKKFNVSDRITITEGAFEDTLYQRLSDQKFSFIFNDSDLYKSTKFSLDFIYPRLVKGGIMIFHNYGEGDNPNRIGERDGRKIEFGERRAVDEFCDLHGIKLNTKKSLAYIQKPEKEKQKQSVSWKTIIKKTSLIDKLKIYGYVFKLSFQKQKRDYDLINQQYNSGVWNRKPWEETDFESSYGNYHLNGSEANERVMWHEGNMVKAKYQDFDKECLSEFLSFFDEFDKMQPIVELGCGLGWNLFNLRRMGFKKLEGYDLSKIAIGKLQKYVKKNGYNIHFGICDLNKPFFENMIKDKVVFTAGCLEQCKHIMENALKNIVNGNPKLVINFEVDYDTSPYIVKKYLDSRDYQNNLVKELKILQKKGDIDLDIKKIRYSISPINVGSAIIWKPKSKN